MLKKLWEIIKIVNSKGLPELPPRETWPIRFLLASEEIWALEAILKRIEEEPAQTKHEVLPTGLSGMLLYRLWQHGLYFNKAWDDNPKCVKINDSLTIVQPPFNNSSTIVNEQSENHVPRTTYHVEPERSELTTDNTDKKAKAKNLVDHPDFVSPELNQRISSAELSKKNSDEGTDNKENDSSTIAQPLFNHRSTIVRIIPTLKKQRLHDLTMVAQRKLALEELDKWAVNWNKERFADDTEKWVKPILIKGGATSKLYFPDESLRLGEDIDVLMPKNMLEDFAGKRVIWATHDCVRKVVADCHFEGHQFTSILDKECNYDNLLSSSSSLEGFDTLTVLNNEDNFYVLVNHFVKHRGDSTHDLIDLSFLINELTIEQSLKRFEEKKRLHVAGSINRFCKELYKVDKLVNLSKRKVELLAKKLELQIYSNFVNELRMAEPFRGIYTEGLIEGHGFIRKMFRHVFMNLEKTKMYFKKQHSNAFYILMHISYAPLRRLSQGLFSGGK